MTRRRAAVIVEAEDINVGYGTIGVVRRANDRRVLHRTLEHPRPYGMRREAQVDAMDWALAHGYVQIEEARL